MRALPPTGEGCHGAPRRRLERFELRGSCLVLGASDGTCVLTPYSEQVMEAAFIPHGQDYPEPSHAVAIAPGEVAVTLTEHADRLEFATAGIVVTIARDPMRLSYAYKGRPLVAEREGYGRAKRHESIGFALEPDEALYGGGARALGMNRRGHRLPLYNHAHYGYETHSVLMSYTMPLVLSSRLYMLHFDNSATGCLDLGHRKRDRLAYETVGGRKTYQVIAGDSWEQLVANYTGLTGRQPLPPRWAFGNFASRFGYRSEAEARATVERYLAEGVPLDAIVFDLYWFGEEMRGSMGNLAFAGASFPDPRGMMADFAAKGVKTILITEPFVLTASKRWREAVERGVLATRADGTPYTFDFYFGNTGLIDIFDPAARDWFWQIYKDLMGQGVAGWWGDLGEPEVHPGAARHSAGTAERLHNIYGHEWSRMLAEGYRRDFPERRPFLLMRAGYSGSQRFGMIPWSGDVNRSWGGLQSQTEIALQMGMQGLAYMHSDLGGFAGPNLDDELYTRWLQYGVFQPVFRPHAQDEVPSEPVYRAPQVLARAREAVRERYRMLPYNYTLAFENSRSGMPLMRPLMFEEPGNPALRGECRSYLWGRDFLVSPVVEPGLARKDMYFPRTSAWFDFYSDARYAGGSTETIAVVPEHIPVFVRAGAFVPLAPPMQSTDGYTGARLELHYYHDPSVSSATGRMYEDDGETPDAYARGRYELLHFAGSFVRDQLALSITSELGSEQARPMRAIALTVHRVAARPQAVLIEGEEAPFRWDGARMLLRVELPPERRALRTVVLRLQLPTACQADTTNSEDLAILQDDYA
jgi:oligosaccharide 4-alpha-D-glucosyltransferase